MSLTTATTLVPTLDAPATNGRAVADSRDYCEGVTRRAAKNFYYGLKLLPEPKRSQMYALYAYMRALDDIADSDNGHPLNRRLDELEAWRALTHDVLAGRVAEPAGRNVWAAFADMVRRRSVPRTLFDAAIAGQAQDLQAAHYTTFEDLHEYCYRVAGVVGVASIYVWGFEGGEETEALAVKRGVAFQLTNILRDLREDAGHGRTYLPREELDAAGVTPAAIFNGETVAEFREMMRFQIDRAERYYRDSAALESRICGDSRPTLSAMTEIYHGLLRKIAREPERVLHGRVSLSLLQKLRIASRASRASWAGRRHARANGAG